MARYPTIGEVSVVAGDSGAAHFAITPSDTVNFAFPVRGVYVGGTGDVVVVDRNGTAVTYKAVPTGQVLPIMASRVNATGTTATYLVGMA